MNYNDPDPKNKKFVKEIKQRNDFNNYVMIKIGYQF